MFMKGAIWIMALDMPEEKVEIFSWMYSMNDSEFGAHRPIFIVLCGLCPDMENAHAHQERNKRLSTRLSGIPLPG